MGKVVKVIVLKCLCRAANASHIYLKVDVASFVDPARAAFAFTVKLLLKGLFVSLGERAMDECQEHLKNLCSVSLNV